MEIRDLLDDILREGSGDDCLYQDEHECNAYIPSKILGRDGQGGFIETQGHYNEDVCCECRINRILSLQGVNSAGEPVRLAVVKVEPELPKCPFLEGDDGLKFTYELAQKTMLEVHYVQEDVK